ncbi:MAG TPA: hypothetical protein VJ742_00695 [Nitrososphaera sp.]|nr:hypothetical protein [Nitrososphaera sp.]
MNLKLVVAALLLASVSAYSKADMFVEVGSSEFNKPIDSLWWQSAYPSEFDLKGQYIRFGGGESVRVWGYDLGRYNSEALATADEHLFFQGKCPSLCKKPDLYSTTGRINGLGVSLNHSLSFVTFEIGAMWAHQTFDLDVKYNTPRRRNITRYAYSESNNGLGYMAGVTLAYENFTLSFNFFDTRKASSFNEGEYPSGVNKVKTLALGYRF